MRPANVGVVAGLRYYSLGIGRWTNRDPVGENGGVGLYAALANCPASDIDVLGRIRLGRTVNNRHEELCKPVWWDLDLEPEGYSPGDPEYSGAIVQHVRMEARVWGCCGDPPPQAFPSGSGPWRRNYYEAWGVSGGLVAYPPGQSTLAIDRYTTGGLVAEGTQGYFLEYGEFAFYTLPDILPYAGWFGVYPVPEAGGLPAFYLTYGHPPLPGFDSRVQWLRAMEVHWKCCGPGKCEMTVNTTYIDLGTPSVPLPFTLVGF